MHPNEDVDHHINQRSVAPVHLLLLKMEEGLPTPRLTKPAPLEASTRKRTQPAKMRAPKKQKTTIQTIRRAKNEEKIKYGSSVVNAEVKVEEAPIVPDPEVQSWDKEFDDLFKSLRDHPKVDPSPPKQVFDKNGIDANLYCPLHSNVLNKKVSQKWWEYTRCDVKNCPIWLPWDQTLQQFLLEIHFNMHPLIRQGLFYCFCEEPSKVGLTKNPESRNVGRCFLTCAQKNAEQQGCKFFQ